MVGRTTVQRSPLPGKSASLVRRCAERDSKREWALVLLTATSLSTPARRIASSTCGVYCIPATCPLHRTDVPGVAVGELQTIEALHRARPTHEAPDLVSPGLV